MAEHSDLLEILEHIDPRQLDYTEWLNVGMALKEAGFTAADWDAWSRSDPDRHHAGECFQKWDGFHGAGNPVKSGTIVQLARAQGWVPAQTTGGHEIGWDDAIGGKDDLVIVDKAWMEAQEVVEPDDWRPVDHLVRYLETLYEASENVGYVTECWEKDGKLCPSRKSGHKKASKNEWESVGW